MDTFQAIYARRAVKHYDPNHSFSQAELDKLFEAVIQSPTSFNMQNWRFVVVTDKAQQKELQAASYNQAQVGDASAVVLLTADLKAWEKQPQRYWKNAPPEVAKMLVDWMGPFYKGNDQLQRDEAMRSCGLAGMTLMLAAKAMGYDSCPMIGFEMDKVAKIIRLPSDHVIGFMVTVGKGIKPVWPKPGQLSLQEVVIKNHF